jgi:hypothetical protein
MTLTLLERMFLKRLFLGPWTSPPQFNHTVVTRLVEAGYARTVNFSAKTTQYQITQAGRAALVSWRVSGKGLSSRGWN